MVILHVEPNSPAAIAGLKPTLIYPDGSIYFGDIIIAIDGKKVQSYEELNDIIQKHRHGDRVTLTILRNNKLIHIQVQLA